MPASGQFQRAPRTRGAQIREALEHVRVSRGGQPMATRTPEPVQLAEQSHAEWLAAYNGSAMQTGSAEALSHTTIYGIESWRRADCSDDYVRAHPYAQAKGIASAGGAGRASVTGQIVGHNADCIVIPIRDLRTGKVVAVQCVNPVGAKQSFGKVSGNALLLGNTLDKSVGWFVTEGWASAYSVVFHHCGGNACCAAAFGKGNLKTVAEVIAEIYEPVTLVIIEEQDR